MDSLFFWLSKLVWLFIAPDSLLVILLVIGCLLLYLGGAEGRAAQWGKYLLSLLAALCLVIALLPVGSWLLWPLETRFETNPKLPAKVDGIIVLGGALGARR
ncbi:MAG: hypothetical protein V3T17_08145, partial [Pseudomonadales bacterium]